MADITAQMVKELRQATGAGVLDCKQALELHDGDFDRAVAYLREKGMVAAAKRAAREAREGLIGHYIHAGSRVGALVEVNCETDFVARTDQFQELAHDLAMQVVAARPLYLSTADLPAGAFAAWLHENDADCGRYPSPADIPTDLLEQKKDSYRKFQEEVCLLEQPFIKDPSITVAELVQQRNALLGENIVVRRFVRFEVGG